MADLYRKSSLEKLSNPEQLDRAITISSPMSWFALLGVVVIIVATVIWSIFGTLPTTATVNGIIVNPENSGAIYCDYAGTVTKVIKKSGDTIKTGDEIAKMKNSAGKEFSIKATQDGTLTAILVDVDAAVYAGSEVARYTPSLNQDQIVICYVPLATAKQLKKDMQVLVYPTSVDSQKYGHMECWIESVGEYAATTSNMWYVVGADNLIAEQFVANGPVVPVICRFKTDSSTKSGLYWTSDNAEDLTVSNGTFVSAKIVVDECAPITKLINGLKEKLEG